MRHVHGHALFIFMSLGGCSEEKQEDESFCESMSEHRIITEGTNSREYVLVVPDSFDHTASSVPLVLNFHGSGGCADEYMESESDLVALANTNNFILAYPQGLPDSEGYPEWRPVTDSTQNIQDNDFTFVERVIVAIVSEYNVNPDQIYAVGLSNGGMFAYGLACRRSKVFAAVGVISGVMLPDSCPEREYTSVIQFHGTSDAIVPFAGNQDFPPVNHGIEHWTAVNGTDSIPTRVELDDGNVKETYAEGYEATSVVLYTIQDGYHVWFDDPVGGKHPNQILWQFLTQYTISGRSD